MNEFLQQFVVESGELAGQAVEGLLKLERSPKDAECLDAVFRAFHTLKGGAGIVEFPAMERAVHAAEELLSEGRSGQRPITSDLVSNCLACLDQVSKWLETIANGGELPLGDIEADAIVRRFTLGGGSEELASTETMNDTDWVQSLRARHSLSGTPTTAIRYTPSADCFFQGEDPAARIAGLPQLLAQELTPIVAWPSLSELDPYACNLLLMALSSAPADSVRAHMQGHVGDCDIVDLSAKIRALQTGDPQSAHLRELLQSQHGLLGEETREQFPGRIASAGRVAANILLAASRTEESHHVRETTEQSLAQHSSLPLQRLLEQLLSIPSEAKSAAKPVTTARASDKTLRVDTARIDALVRLTGELTMAKNALAHTTSRAGQEDLTSLTEVLKGQLKEFEHLIQRLQRTVLALRVLPLRSVLQRFPRVLRDISSALGKPVVLHIEGDHTEADKAIVDMLFEPLLHALRNAVDHGIESPARRMELNKPLIATVRVRAKRVSDRVIVEVEDDGGGVNVRRVGEVALARNIVTPEALEAMSEAQIVDLIFAPGFSTATAISEISGRGVGLDAVRNTVQRVGGQVSLVSLPGQGTTLSLSVPFSVMVTQVLTVEAGAQTFGVPLDALLETVKVPRQLIAGVGAARVIVHRGRTIALIDLASELGQGNGIDALDLAEVTVVLASVSDEIIALRVERIGERIEVILKPLEGLLAGLKGITGTTVLGDGQVLLVLDLWELLT